MVTISVKKHLNNKFLYLFNIFSLNQNIFSDILNYKPGICNIGKNEIRKRYLYSILGFATFFILFAISKYYNFQLPFVVYWLTSLAGFEGLFQGHFRFCATFALFGVYDFSGSAKEKGKVSNQLDRRKDLWAMLKIHVYSLVASLVLSLIVVIF